MGLCKNCDAMLEPRKMLCRRCGFWTPNGDGVIAGSALKETDLIDAMDVQAQDITRIVTGGPWDDAWGGGFVPSTITLLGGAPGAGKTTLLLQLSVVFAQITKRPTYYISPEQHKGALKLTIDRLQLPLERGMLRLLNTQGAGGSIDEGVLDKTPPGMMILDSVSALCGNDKHMQVAVCKQYIKYAIKYNCKCFLIAHMTKEHDYAGLMALQHEVDTLVTLFPEEDGSRHLKPWKNRYGSTHEEYKLLMTERGLIAAPPKPGKKQKKLLGVDGEMIDQINQALREDGDLDEDEEGDEQDERDEEDDELEERAPKRKKAPAPETIEVNGQKLVRKERGGRGERADRVERTERAERKTRKPPVTPPPEDRAHAIEGEALKRKRPPMPREKPREKARKEKIAAKVKKAPAKKAKAKPDKKKLKAARA